MRCEPVSPCHARRARADGIYPEPVIQRLRSPVLFRRLAVACVVANCVIVLTGAAVRLTSSGLGCPTWPRCTDATLTPTPQYAVHGLIEFSNRMLTFALTAVVVATLVVAFRQQRGGRPRVGVRWLAVLLFLGIPAQAILGGITVLTGLNPWSVAGHFLLSTVLIGLAVALQVRAGRPDTPAVPVLRPELVWLTRALALTTLAVIIVGTVVTGSGPHSGDPAAGRTGLDPRSVSQLHADLVMLVVGLSVATWLALRATAAPAPVRRASGWLLGALVVQATIGFVQYFTGVPGGLVAAHVAGSCLVWVAAMRVWLLSFDRPAGPGEQHGAADLSVAGQRTSTGIAAASRSAAPVA